MEKDWREKLPELGVLERKSRAVYFKPVFALVCESSRHTKKQDSVFSQHSVNVVESPSGLEVLLALQTQIWQIQAFSTGNNVWSLDFDLSSFDWSVQTQDIHCFLFISVKFLLKILKLVKFYDFCL